MPVANEHIHPSFNLNLEDPSTSANPSPPSQPEDPWATLAAAAKKKKKKSKKSANSAAVISADAAVPTKEDTIPPKAASPLLVADAKHDRYPTRAESPPPPPLEEPVEPHTELDLNPVFEGDDLPLEAPHSPDLLEADPPQRMYSPVPSLASNRFAGDNVDLGSPPPSPKPIPKGVYPFSRDTPAVVSPRPAAVRPSVPPSPPVRTILPHHAAHERQRSISGPRPIIPGSNPSLLSHAPSRTESLSVSPRPARFVEPPLPHMPQPHFWGLPDLGLNLKPTPITGKAAGSDGYCCSLDTFTDAGDEASAKKARDAILVGSDGGLDVYRVLPNKLEVIGRLEGLRGAVVAAKILPHIQRHDPLQHLRPLVALTVHGPAPDHDQESSSGGTVDTSEHYQTTVEVYSLQTHKHYATLYSSNTVTAEPPVGRQVAPAPGPVGELSVAAEGAFITVVSGKSGEVWVYTMAPHLVTGDTPFRCIGKFWTSLQTPREKTVRAASTGDAAAGNSETPEPQKTPMLSLSSRWLVVVPPSNSASISIQGQVLTADFNSAPPGLTTFGAPMQPLVLCEVVGTDVEGAWSRLSRQAAQGLVKYSQKGIEMSLQGWKELTHPTPPGNRPVAAGHERVASEDNLFPPTKGPSDDPERSKKEPALVSVIDLQSLLEWEATKPKHLPPPMATFALIDGCSFVSLSSTGVRLLTSNRKGEVSTIWDLTQAAHGVPHVRSASAARYDDDIGTGPCVKQLHRIVRSTPSTILECAWSVDDDAVALLTGHGTVHLHEVPTTLATRKRKRRSTVSTAASPLFGATGLQSDKADATLGLSAAGSPPSSSAGGFLGSLKSGWQSVSTQVGSLRGAVAGTPDGPTNAATALGLPTTFAGFREATAAAGQLGSRAVARGLSQGLSAAKGGASDYWHADDNKIRLTKPPIPSSTNTILRWVRRPGTTSSSAASASSASIVVLATPGKLQVHPVQRVVRRKGDGVVSGLKHEKYARKEFALAPIPAPSRTAGHSGRQQSKGDACAAQGPHGFWSLRRPSPSPPLRSGQPGIEGRHYHMHQPMKYAGTSANSPFMLALKDQASDVETNPPYCPFHVDQRVGIFAFVEESKYNRRGVAAHGADLGMFGVTHVPPPSWTTFSQRGHGASSVSSQRSAEPWIFGDPLPNYVRINDRVVDDEGGSFDDDVVGDEDLLRAAGDADNDDDDDDEEAFASQVRSRLTIAPGPRGVDDLRGDGGGRGGGVGESRRATEEPEIRINTRRRIGKARGGAADAAQRKHYGGIQDGPEEDLML